MQAEHHVTNNFLLKVSLVETFMRQWNSNQIRVTQILTCFVENGCKKWRDSNRFAVLAEYLKHQIDYNRYKRKISKSRKITSWSNQSYLPFLFKHMETMLQSYQHSATWSQNGFGKLLLISLNYKQLRVEVRNSMSIF